MRRDEAYASVVERDLNLELRDKNRRDSPAYFGVGRCLFIQAQRDVVRVFTAFYQQRRALA